MLSEPQNSSCFHTLPPVSSDFRGTMPQISGCRRRVRLPVWSLRDWRHGPVAALLVFQGESFPGLDGEHQETDGKGWKRMEKDFWFGHENISAKSHLVFSSCFQRLLLMDVYEIALNCEVGRGHLFLLYVLIQATALSVPCIETCRLVRREGSQCAALGVDGSFIDPWFFPASNKWLSPPT